MNEIIDTTSKSIIKFLLVSGIGWGIDFSLYIILISLFDLSILNANFISTIPAITFVFFIATKKIFKKNNTEISLWVKYFIYFFYQIGLVTVVSLMGQIVYDCTVQTSLSQYPLHIFIKIIITFFTIITNFIVMKILAEKL